jgi:hypothetical protein
LSLAVNHPQGSCTGQRDVQVTASLQTLAARPEMAGSDQGAAVMRQSFPPCPAAGDDLSAAMREALLSAVNRGVDRLVASYPSPEQGYRRTGAGGNPVPAGDGRPPGRSGAEPRDSGGETNGDPRARRERL